METSNAGIYVMLVPEKNWENRIQISSEKANELWRRVLARLVIDYFEDYRNAKLQVMGESLEILCEILNLDTERTRKELLLAKKEYQKSGKLFGDWIRERWNGVNRY